MSVKEGFVKLLEAVSNKWFVGFVVWSIIAILVWSTDISPFWKLIVLIIQCVIYTKFTQELLLKPEVDVFQKLRYYLLVAVFWLYPILYLAALLNDELVLISSLILIPEILIVTALIPYFAIFWKSKDLAQRLTGYLVFSVLLIIFFGHVFSVIDALPGQNELGVRDGLEKPNLYDYVYFSSTIYYSTSFGEYYPMGFWMRLMTQIEALFSIGIHIFLISEIYSRVGCGKISVKSK